MRRERVRATLTEEPFKQGVAADLEVCRNVSEDSGQGSNTEWGMLRDRQVMLAMFVRGQAKMTAGLAGDGIAEFVECLGQVVAREIAGKPHTAMTSSRTWCSRTTLGDCPSSK